MANVLIKNDRYTVDPLYQWDKNQVLTIYGLSLASIPEIHFTNTGMDRAIVRQATMDDAGIISADIPNSLLQKPYTITAYVCIYEGDTFKSLYAIDIPVKDRKKPGDYTIENTDGEIYSFNAIENKVENFIRNITDQTETFKNDMSNKFSDTEKKVNTAIENIDQYKTNTDISIDQYKKDIDERVSSSENIVNGYDDRLSLAETDIIGIREAIGDEWNETTTYNAGDLKIYNNILWECLVNNVGQTPEEGTYWTKRQITDLFGQLNTDSQWKKITVPEPSVSDGSRIYTIDLSTYKEICIRIWIMAWLGSVDIKIIPLNMSTKKYIHCYYDGTYYANAEVTVTQNDITVKTVASNMTSSNYYLIGELCAR